MCSVFFTIHWLLLSSSWWALSIHPLSFDTRYLFSQFLGYNGCPAESLSFIPLSFILYHLIQDIYFPQISGYHWCPAESLSFILASGLFWHRSWPPPALFRQHPSHLPIFCLHRHQTKANTNTTNYTHLLLPASIIWIRFENSRQTKSGTIFLYESTQAYSLCPAYPYLLRYDDGLWSHSTSFPAKPKIKDLKREEGVFKGRKNKGIKAGATFYSIWRCI